MSGDFTRTRFRPDKQFSSVRLQQGRALLDADWNEQADIARWFARAALQDTVGPCGFPQDKAGFGLVSIADDLLLTPGRAYVGGALIVNPEPRLVDLEKIDDSGANAAYRVVQGEHLRVGQQLLHPTEDLGQSTVGVVDVGTDADGHQVVELSAPLGEGERKTRRVAASLGSQPNLLTDVRPSEAGLYLAYLEVWERSVGALEDDELREVALGGPDTSRRDRLIWQVRLYALKAALEAGDLESPPTCKSFPPGWRPDGDLAPAMLAARARAQSAAEDPCVLPPAGGYRSLENHLYRVEIHTGGSVGGDGLTWKWSRDNAMHEARLLEVADRALVVDDPGPDAATSYRGGDWLEVLDESRILEGLPGLMVELSEVNGPRLGVGRIIGTESGGDLTDVDGQPDVAKLPTSGKVRRWEGGPPVELKEDWLHLEDGIEIRIGPGRVWSGDFWTIPARTLTASVEWNDDEASGEPVWRPPEGITRHFCPLAIVSYDEDAGLNVDEDCRRHFPPLTSLETFQYLGGDGQEARPDLTAPNKRVGLGTLLRVGVSRGGRPVEGRPVRFAVRETAKNAKLLPTEDADVIASTTRVLVVRTNAEGVAEAGLALHPQRFKQHVDAELLDTGHPEQADPAHLPITFTATLSMANMVAFNPAWCAYQGDEIFTAGGSKNVQEALTKLCPAPSFQLISGGSQLLQKGTAALEPLVVGLFWGKNPMAGARVTFEVVGDATVEPAEAEIGADGTAAVVLRGGNDPLANGGAVHVIATAPDLPMDSQPNKVVATAVFAAASAIHVDPDVCPPSQIGGQNTVAAALRYLCERPRGEEKGVHVTNIRLIESRLVAQQQTLPAHVRVDPRDLARGVEILLDDAIDAKALSSGPVGKLVLDQRYPITGEQADWFRVDLARGVTAFHHEIEISGTFHFARTAGSPGLPGGNVLTWRPSELAEEWLGTRAGEIISAFDEDWASRLVVYGGRIWSEGDPDTYLDGDLTFSSSRPGGVRYPSGNGVRGGDLVFPFRVGNVTVIGPVVLGPATTTVPTTLVTPT